MVPKLRFKEFCGEWEEERLGDVAEIYKGNTLSKSDLRDEGYPCILYGELYTKYGEIIERVYSKTNRTDKNLFRGKNNDVLIPSSGETAIDISTASCLKCDNVYIGGYLNVIRCNDINGSFLSYNLNHKQKNSIAKFAQGVSVVHIYGDSLRKLKIKIPSLPEQTKIADFLSTVDDKIQNQQDKITHLENIKKGFMQKIFSRKIRFKDDGGEEFPKWGEKKLGNICNITTGKLDANAMNKDGKYRFYTCAAEYYRINSYAFDTEALIISGNGANVGYIHYYKGKFNAYQRTYILDNFFYDIKYIKIYLDKYLHKRIENEKKAGNTPYIVLSTLYNMKIELPCLEEQTKIADFISSFDEKISTEKEILEYLKQLKKGLLQQMFI